MLVVFRNVIALIWLSGTAHVRNPVPIVLQVKINSSPGHNRPVPGTVCSKMTRNCLLYIKIILLTYLYLWIHYIL